MSGKIKQNSDNIILNYALRKEYFVNKNLYFKDLHSQVQIFVINHFVY